jgi:hypothetical protein
MDREQRGATKDRMLAAVGVDEGVHGSIWVIDIGIWQAFSFCALLGTLSRPTG